jgi:hypothetical protein
MLLIQLPLLIALAMAPLQFMPAAPDSALIPGPVSRADSLLESARSALGRGRPWQASRLIAPVVGDSSQRTPSAVILAATAASRWGGWPEVGRLLEGEAWLDSLFEGRGRVLLARSALDRGPILWRWPTRSPLPGGGTPSPRASASSCSPPRSTG